MGSKSLLLLGLVFAIVLFISSDLVSSARDLQPQTKEEGKVKVDDHDHCDDDDPDCDHGEHHYRHRHRDHCDDDDPNCGDNHNNEEAEGTDHHESTFAQGKEDGLDKHKCKHWPHC